MTSDEAATAFILIASDKIGDAELIQSMLEAEFRNVRITTAAGKVVADFDDLPPDVLVLAYDTLDKAERCLLELHRQSRMVHMQPHRNLTLCGKDQVPQAYAACRDGKFDDYIQFWPMTNDSTRLPMAIRVALRELGHLRQGESAVRDIALEARRLSDMENVFQDSMSQGVEHLETTERLVAQAEIRIGAAFDGLTKRLSQGDSPLIEVRDADRLAREVERVKSEDIHQPMHSVAQSLVPLAQWTRELKQDMQPHLEAARAVTALAAQTQPVVLVVDDDEFQRDLLRIILSAKNYRAVLAASGAEAIAMLRATRPDIVLMDMMMPQMDGVQATQKIKEMPENAQLPVIMVTGKSDNAVVRDALRAGAVDFIVKPVERNALLAKMERALRLATSAPASPPSAS